MNRRNPLKDFITPKGEKGYVVHMPRELAEPLSEPEREVLSAIMLIMWKRYENGEEAQIDSEGHPVFAVLPDELSRVLDIKPSEAEQRLADFAKAPIPMACWTERAPDAETASRKAASRQATTLSDNAAPFKVNARGDNGSN